MKIRDFVLSVLTILALSMGAFAATGTAIIVATSESSTVSGAAIFTETKDGLKVVVDLANAPAGNHGFHIHEFGSCSDTGKAAGNHYNPLGHPHGNVLKDGVKKAHAGDLGNISVGPDGKAHLEAVVPELKLAGGTFTVGGRALILHEKADDFGQPLGNAGGRIGCGPIVITGN